MPNDTNAKIPAKIALPHLLALAATGVLLRLALSAGMRAWAAQPRSAIPVLWAGTTVLALTLLLLWQLRVIWKRRDSWALYLGAALLLILFYKAGNNRPELSPVEIPLAILLLLPAGLLVWAFVRQVRQADELERRILLQALAFAFVVEFTVAIAYALLEGMDVARPPSILWASLLVMSWAVGLGIFHRRYE
ncbi:MAG TPA: hypothetical protein VGK26_13620 [Thermoanaerobaculia bacterium]|jgi:hypothetical protein